MIGQTRTSGSADARMPAGARASAVPIRPASLTCFVPVAGMIAVGVIMPSTEKGSSIAKAASFALVIADLGRRRVASADHRGVRHG